MKHLLSIIIFLSLLLVVESKEVIGFRPLSPSRDSIPAFPPENNASLTGPSSACLGETCTYRADVPVACPIQWLIDGTLLGTDTMPLQVIWPDTGLYTVSLNIICDTS